MFAKNAPNAGSTLSQKKSLSFEGVDGGGEFRLRTDDKSNFFSSPQPQPCSTFLSVSRVRVTGFVSNSDRPAILHKF